MKSEEKFVKSIDEENLQTLSTVAAMYYLDGLSQNEIARRFYTSRSTISRILKKARSRGIVEIRVKFSSGRNRYYEDKLKELFDVDAVILNSDTLGLEAEDSIDIKIRRELAVWMQDNIHSGDIVGVTRGAIFYDIPDYLNDNGTQNVSFVQLMGTEALSAGRHYARDIITRLSRFYGGKPSYLDAPLVFEGQEARETLFKVPTIARTLSAVEKASVLLTTVPKLEKNQKIHIWQGFIGDEDFDKIICAGAVGAMFGRAFDIDGRFLDVDLNRSIVSTDMETIKSRKILAVSYGKEFSRSVLGALRSRYLNYLISDSDCIKEILRLIKKA